MQKIFQIYFVLISILFSQKFSGDSYQSQNRQQKLEQLYSEIQNDQSSGSFPNKTDFQISKQLEKIETTMNLHSDQFPSGRSKLIHSVGSTGLAEFISEQDSPYTGLFKGADSLIMRFSTTSKPNTPLKTEHPYKPDRIQNNFTPSIALKFLINGLPSANLVAMFNVNGNDSWNFFGKDISNHIGPARKIGLKFISSKFSQVTKFIQTVGLKKIATHDQDGQQVGNPKYPWKVVLRASSSVNNLFSDTYVEDYTEQLKSIRSGTHIYDVFAVENPEDGCEKKIGRIVSKSQLNTSKFGDEQLFFQHQKMDNDLQDRQEWIGYTPFWNFHSFASDQQTDRVEGNCPQGY